MFSFVTFEDDGEDDEDSHDGWEEVCGRTQQYCDDDLKIYGTLYETYGGGPAGGYILDEGADGEDFIFAWHQDWGTKKQYTKLDGKRLEFKTDDHGTQFIKVVDDDYTIKKKDEDTSGTL